MNRRLKTLRGYYNKGIGGIDGCTENTTRWFLLLSTIPLFLVVCILPIVQNAAHPQVLPVIPTDRSAYQTPYQYGMDIIKALSFRNIIFSQKSQVCKVVKRRQEDSQVFTVRVIGERHSGAPWLLRQLSRQLPNVTIGGGLIRGKNWFQTERNLKQIIFRRHGLDSQEVDKLLQKTLVIVITRSPYEWILAMHKRPFRAPNHIFRDWKKFISRPWTIPTVPRDKLISRTKGAWCQLNFEAGEVTPCRTNALIHQHASTKKYPVYEHHPVTHKPFKNILGLRQAKLENFLNLSAWLPNVKYISIESLIESGMNDFLQELHEEYGLGYCNTEIEDTNYELQVSADATTSNLDFMKYLTCKLNWRVEQKFNYEPNYHFLINRRTKRREKCRDVHTIHA